MANDSVTIAVTGELSLDEFAKVVQDFRALVDTLSSEVGGQTPVEWMIDYLEGGSATMTTVGQSTDPEVVERVVRAYSSVGRSLAEGRPIPYSDRVQKVARSLTEVLDGRVTEIRFETPEDEVSVVSPAARPEVIAMTHAYGVVEGRVQTLTSRGRLRFILYDSLYGRAVSCYLRRGQEDLMRDAWERRAVVAGWVSRDGEGRPVSVSQVTKVSLLDEVPRGSYRQARGVVPLRPDDPSPEDMIRAARDA